MNMTAIGIVAIIAWAIVSITQGAKPNKKQGNSRSTAKRTRATQTRNRCYGRTLSRT